MTTDTKMEVALVVGLASAVAGAAAEDKGWNVAAAVALGVAVLALLAAVWWLVQAVWEASS